MNKVLQGVKVIDMTLAASGPSCSKVLTDYGADTIFVEPPSGSNCRNYHNVGFYTGGKRSIAIDLKNPDGMRVIYQLIKEADVFVSNYRTKGLKKLGLDWETLHELNPGLVYATLDGFGEYGPEKDTAGFDPVAYWARSGMLTATSDAECGLPVINGGLGDCITGQELALGVCAALYHKAVTGEGTKVHTSLFTCGLFINNDSIIEVQYGAKYPVSRKSPHRSLLNTYPCKDGWVYLCTINFTKDFFNIMKALGRDDLVGDPRWKTMADTEEEHSAEVVKIFEDAMADLTMDEVISKLNAYDIACQKVCHPQDVITDEQALANNYLYPYTNPDGHTILLPAPTVKFGDNEPFTAPRVPYVGEQTTEIMKEYGFSDEEISKMLDSGAVVETDRWECTIK